MTPQLLKLNIRFISLIYSNLINKCITHNNFPLSLKHSIITPIIKKTSLDYSIPNNYIPISNLSLLPPLHVHLYLTYFLYILSPIQFSHMYNVHCTLPSHAIPSHVTSLHILPQLLPRFYLF